MKLYISFGENHSHTIGNQTFNKDCMAVLVCPDIDTGWAKIIKLFDRKHGIVYGNNDILPSDKDRLPRKFIDLGDDLINPHELFCTQTFSTQTSVLKAAEKEIVSYQQIPIEEICFQPQGIHSNTDFGYRIMNITNNEFLGLLKISYSVDQGYWWISKFQMESTHE